MSLQSMFHRHLDERRLAEIAGDAGAEIPGDAVAEPLPDAERSHLASCAECRRLLNGHRRVSAVLAGDWADRPAVTADDAVRERLRVVEVPRPRPRRVGLVQLAGVAGLLVLASSATFLWLSSRPSAAPAATPWPEQGTRVVATLPGDGFEWSPDGRYLLTWSVKGSSVFDRSGKLVSTFRRQVGWLDAEHLIGPDGEVVPVTGPDWAKASLYTVRPVANGHGVAAVKIAQPACPGDPMFHWYRNGTVEAAPVSLSPFGWSVDGRRALQGHFACEGLDAYEHGWKGRVDVVDVATGEVLASVSDVRGSLSLSPLGTVLAAQSDRDTKFLDIASGVVTTLSGRLLGWNGYSGAFLESNGAIFEVTLPVPSPLSTHPDVNATPAPPLEEWQMTMGGGGARVVVRKDGAVDRLLASDGTTLLDLSALHLTAPTAAAVPEGDRWWLATEMLPRLWSPDGGMVALPGPAGIALISVAGR